MNGREITVALSGIAIGLLGIFISAKALQDYAIPTEWKDGGLIKHDKAVYRLVEAK